MEKRNTIKIIKISVVVLCILLNIPFLTKCNSQIGASILYDDLSIKNLKMGNSVESPILIDGEATGVNAHNWTWAASQDWCNGSGTEFDPYRISQVNINGMGVNNCIEIRNSKNDYFMIDHCIFLNAGNANPHTFAANVLLNNSKYGKILSNEIIGASSDLATGIYVEDCSYLQIVSNNFSENRFNAIHLIHSFASIISNNIIYNNRYMGIYVVEGSQTINITNNLVDQNYDGIGIVEGSYSWIYNNTIRNNYLDGIICSDCYDIEIASNEVTSSNVGIYVQECRTLSLIANTIEKNEYGIIFKLSNTNHIYDNVIIRNNYYPLWLYSSNYNRILGNIITENKETIAQINCIGNEFIDNVIFNQTEQQFLTITIIGISFFVVAAILLIQKWKKLKR